MIASFITAIKSCTEFYVFFGVVSVAILIFSPLIFSKIHKSSRKSILLSIFLEFFVSLVFATLLFLIYVSLMKLSMGNLNIFLLVTSVYFLSLNLSLFLDVKEAVLRTKKASEFYATLEKVFSENRKRVLDVLLFFSLVLVAMLTIASKEVSSFLIMLFVSVFACSCVSAFVYPSLLKLSEKSFEIKYLSSGNIFLCSLGTF